MKKFVFTLSALLVACSAPVDHQEPAPANFTLPVAHSNNAVALAISSDGPML